MHQLKGGILDESKLLQLDKSDRQIKMIPDGQFQISDIQSYLGVNWDIQEAEKIRDSYFKHRDGVSVCLREFPEKSRRQLIVKRSRNKAGVTQMERERFSHETEITTPIETLIDEFNKKYEETSVDVKKCPLECIIETRRMNSMNDDGVIIRRDVSEVLGETGKVKLPETIEIDCADKGKMKDIRKKISTALKKIGIDLKDVTTKEKKEKMAIRVLDEQGNTKNQKLGEDR